MSRIHVACSEREVFIFLQKANTSGKEVNTMKELLPQGFAEFLKQQFPLYPNENPEQKCYVRAYPTGTLQPRSGDTMITSLEQLNATFPFLGSVYIGKTLYECMREEVERGNVLTISSAMVALLDAFLSSDSMGEYLVGGLDH